MRELHRHTGVLQLFAQYGFLPGLLFEGDDIGSECLTLRVISHIQQSETDLTQTGSSHHEVTTLHNATYQLVGQGLACLIVEGKRTQKVLFYGKVLHKLRGQFHEVP